MKYILSQGKREREDQDSILYLLIGRNQKERKKELPDLVEIWSHPLDEDKAQEVVLELLEEEVEMIQVIQVEMMVQTEM